MLLYYQITKKPGHTILQSQHRKIYCKAHDKNAPTWWQPSFFYDHGITLWANRVPANGLKRLAIGSRRLAPSLHEYTITAGRRHFASSFFYVALAVIEGGAHKLCRIMAVERVTSHINSSLSTSAGGGRAERDPCKDSNLCAELQFVRVLCYGKVRTELHKMYAGTISNGERN